MGQAGALSIQNDPVLTTFSANGLICAAVVEFNSVPALTTVSLTQFSRVEQSLVIAQGEGTQGACSASINSTSGACTGGTPACYSCLGNAGVASNCGSPITALAPICGSDKSFCPTARALSLIGAGNGGTNTVDGAGTFGSGAGTGSNSGSTGPVNGNTGSTTPVSTKQTGSAVSNAAAVFLVAVALFAGF